MKKPLKNISKEPSENLFPVVGIGSSEGGLDALKKLIRSIPLKSGMAYIVVQHLHADHESALTEILQRETKIPVVTISDKVHVEPDFIYIIPSNKLLKANDGILKLKPLPAKNKRRLAIDLFFSSFAEVYQSQSIGVILSGKGCDGTLGLRDIKNNGGFTFAQDPETAYYRAMPQHAIDAGIVDFILPPEKIADKLKELQHSIEMVDLGSIQLQSLNEELKIREKELQSTTKEQVTINLELYDRSDEVDRSRIFLDSIITLLHEPLLVLDKEFVIKMANRAFYKTFEITEEETLEKKLFELQGGCWDIAGLRKELQKIRKEKRPMIEVEIKHTFPAIGYRDICFNIQKMDKEGTEPLILLALGDITERKKSERILEESEKKFRNLVYGLPVAVCLCDPEGYINLYNESAVELWGHKPVIGQDKWCDTWKIFSKEGNQIPVEECPMTIALKEGRFINQEIIVERVDGGRRNILPYPRLLYDENNKITGCINTMIDVTEQAKSQKLVQQHADRLKSFFMQTPAILCILRGPEYVFELANPLYRKFINNPDPIGRKLIDVLPEIKEQGFIEVLDKVYSTGQSYTSNERPISIERKKGKPIERYIDFNYQAYSNELGKTEGILVFAYDVTEKVLARKQLEQNAEMIQYLYMNAPAFICTYRGPNHIYDLVNPAYQKLFGSRKIEGKPLLEALPELKGQGIKELLDKVFQTGEIFVATELLVWTAYDVDLLPEERYFNFSYQPIYDANKKVGGILVFGYEVTREVLAKKRTDANIKLVLESIPLITVTANADGKITFFNQYALDYSGLSNEEATTG
ncbi:MAG: chemotaxis protein CheB, partial [Ginsengibacter sp.]